MSIPIPTPYDIARDDTLSKMYCPRRQLKLILIDGILKRADAVQVMLRHFDHFVIDDVAKEFDESGWTIYLSKQKFYSQTFTIKEKSGK